MKPRQLAFLGALALVASTAGAGPDRTIDETRPLEAGGRIEIENISGSIEVVATARDGIHVTGRIDAGVERVDIEKQGAGLRVRVVLPRRSHRGGSADLKIEIPLDASVEVETVSADIRATGVGGDVSLESVSGSLELDGVPREVELHTVSGDIRLIATAPLRNGRFETVSGDVEFRGELAADGRFRFSSVSGSIDLHLPAGAGAELEASTFSGRIKAPGYERTNSRGHGPGEDANVTLGGGGARIKAESFSGNVEIHEL